MPTIISQKVAEAIEKCVVCWLATVDDNGHPNVSPKEGFVLDENEKILIANIASPGSVRNIARNPRVCVSLINVFTQKGYKFKGDAKVWGIQDPEFKQGWAKLTAKIGTAYPIASVIEVHPAAVEEIVAPSYRLFPDTTELERIRESLQSYDVAGYQTKAKQS